MGVDSRPNLLPVEQSTAVTLSCPSSEEMADSETDKQLVITRKLVIIGDGAIGKTCLLQVFLEGKFPDGYEPTIFHNENKKMKHPFEEGKEFNMQLWDTAGQEAYEEARKLAYPGTQILLIGFSVVEPDSLANVTIVWKAETQKHAGLKKAPIILVGLKGDLRDDPNIIEALQRKEQDVVSEEKAREVAKQIGAQGYYETSAKTNSGVDAVFEAAAKIAFQTGADVTPNGLCANCV